MPQDPAAPQKARGAELEGVVAAIEAQLSTLPRKIGP